MSDKYCVTFKQSEQEFLSTSLSVSEIIDSLSEEEVDRLNNMRKTKTFSLVKPEMVDLNPSTITISINKKLVIDNLEKINDSVLKIKDINLLKDTRLIAGHDTLTREIKDVNTNKDFNVLILLEDDNLNSKLYIETAYLKLNEGNKKINIDRNIVNYYELCYLDRYSYEDALFLATLYTTNTINETKNILCTNILEKNIVFYPDIHKDKAYEVIPVTLFFRVHKPLFQMYLKENEVYSIAQIKEIARIVAKEIIIPAYNIVFEKWGAIYRTTYLEENFYEICFPKSSYLNRRIAMAPICKILIDILYCLDGDINETIQVFKFIIQKTNIISSDWVRGGRFTGLTSENGQKKVVEILCNSKHIDDIIKEYNNQRS